MKETPVKISLSGFTDTLPGRLIFVNYWKKCIIIETNSVGSSLGVGCMDIQYLK